MEKLFLEIDKSLKIPYYTFGKKPKVLLMAGMHGNEKSAILILDKLLKKVKKMQQMNVTIVPIVNKPAYEKNSRVNLNDREDLNRIFPITKTSSQTHKIGEALQDLSEKYEIVIDLHDFVKRKAMVCGVDLNSRNKKIRQNLYKIFSSIGVDAVCKIDKKHEPEKEGSLAQYLLHKKNKIALGIELPDRKALTKKQINNMLRGLLNVVKLYSGQKNHKITRKKVLPLFIRQNITAKKSGSFLPKKEVGDHVKTGDIVGILDTSNDIVSNYDGTLVSISYPGKVKMGEKIVTIGKKVTTGGEMPKPRESKEQDNSGCGSQESARLLADREKDFPKSILASQKLFMGQGDSAITHKLCSGGHVICHHHHSQIPPSFG